MPRSHTPRMQKWLGAALVAVVLASAARADDYATMDCAELWQARNQIFADAGYCFKSEPAVAVFGQRCFPPYGKLTEAETKIVEEIRTHERARKCKIDG